MISVPHEGFVENTVQNRMQKLRSRAQKETPVLNFNPMSEWENACISMRDTIAR
jgi:hypothetical protein